jgi:hypothetical protein
MGPLIDKLAGLKAQLQQVLPAQRIPGIVHEALRLDKEAQVLGNTLPDSWRYQVKHPDMTPSCAYQGVAPQISSSPSCSALEHSPHLTAFLE